MFGLSKRERYESELNVALLSFLGDVVGLTTEETRLTPFLRDRIKTHWKGWSGIISEAISLKRPPQVTAIALVELFYQDMIHNFASEADREKIRRAIIENDLSISDRMNIMFRLYVTTRVISGTVSDDGEIKMEMLHHFITSIHRSLFENDENWEKTAKHLIEGSESIKQKVLERVGSALDALD